MMKRLAVYVFLIAVAVLLFGCSSGGPSDTLSEEDQVAIYAAVIRQLAGPDDTFGGTLEKPILYIMRETNPAAGDPAQAAGEPAILSDNVQQGITAALADLPSELVWIDSRDELELDDGGAVVGGGVIMSLGNITPQPGGEVYVPGSLYVASLAAGGQTYILEQQGNEWVVTGNTGVEWIS